MTAASPNPAAATPWAPATCETHVSTLVFVGDRAYKFLKPVKLAFLDHSTVEQRRQGCENELWLNRRIAPDVYLGIGDVREDDEVVDHFVVMRRLPTDRRLSRLVTTAEGAHAVREVARTVAKFHATQPRTETARRAASLESVRELWRANLAEMDTFAGSYLAPWELDTAGRLAWQFLDGRAPLFRERVERGFAVDGHGDLLADDIFVLSDGPRVLDCLAFDPLLREGDVLLDVAFLTIDLERLGAGDLATRLIDWYCEFSNEHHPRALAEFYIAYRALVRCKVSCLAGDAPAAQAFMAQCLRHLRASQPVLVLVGGTPGTGKTTVAQALGDAKGMVVLSSDELRKDLAGLGHDEHAFASADQGLYAPEIKAQVYGELDRQAQQLLARGESVVLDASFSHRAEREAAREIGRRCSVDVVELRCVVDQAIARERIARRLANPFTPSDATPEIADHLAATADPWPEAVWLDTLGTIAETTDRAVAALEHERAATDR